jgi:peptidoglycan hydrolase CwlO-like protein
MGITLVIVGGITIISAIAIVGDYFTKAKVSKTSIDPQIIQALEKRIEELETKANDQDKKIEQLESEISFANKLLENKTK